LITSSTGSDNTQSNGCPNYPDLGGSPTKLAVTHLTGICCDSQVAQWEAGGVVTRIRTAPHPEGIWIVWRTDDGIAPVLRRARIRPELTVPVGYEAIGEPQAVPGAFDAVVFGSRLAVVWIDSATGVHRLRVTMLGLDGVVEDFTPVQLEIPPGVDDLSVVAGPEGTGLLVGFDDGRIKRLVCRRDL
jgi:hypothetical protein